MSQVLNVSEFLIWQLYMQGLQRVLKMSEYASVCLNTEIFNKPFFLTTMTSQLLKYLNEQLRVFLNMKQQN